MGTRRVALSIAALVVLGACADEGEPPAAVPAQPAIVVAVLRHLDVAPMGDTELPIVYVVEVGSDPLSLDEQVTVIQELDERYDVRFVDDVESVTETGDDGALVLPDDGPLVAVGTAHEGPRPSVRTELRAGTDPPSAWQVEFDGEGDSLRVVETTVVQPEFLVDPAAP